MASTEQRFVFETECFDERASLIRKYLLTFYPKNNTIEMFDMKTKKIFLKRMECAGLTLDKLYIGSTVTIFSRQLKLVDYADVYTRNQFADNTETGFALIKPDVYVHTGKIIDEL